MKNFKKMINEFSDVGTVEHKPENIADVKPVETPADTVVDTGAVSGDGVIIKDNAYYAYMKDPKTGFAYNIPLLRFDDPNYIFKYIDYMKMKEEKPEQFKRIMEWA